jgi:hypothetical protein
MPTALEVHDALWAKLDAVASVNAYDGEVPNNPPVDADGRVHLYAVLYFTPGRLYASALDGAQTSLDGIQRITCVGGDPVRAANCVDKVRAGLIGPVTIAGRSYLIRADEADPGPVRPDLDKTPPRHYVPVLFRLITP